MVLFYYSYSCTVNNYFYNFYNVRRATNTQASTALIPFSLANSKISSLTVPGCSQIFSIPSWAHSFTIPIPILGLTTKSTTSGFSGNPLNFYRLYPHQFLHTLTNRINFIACFFNSYRSYNHTCLYLLLPLLQPIFFH